MITKVMGILLFCTGLGIILLGIAGMLGFLTQLNGLEEVFLTVGGAILCVLGYMMARDRPIADLEEEDKPEG